MGATPQRSNDLSTEIPTQPLPRALAALADSMHSHFVYLSQLALGKNSQSVPGGLSAREGLSRLLEGTGLKYKFLGPDTVMLLELPMAKPSGRGHRRVFNEIVVSAMKRDKLLSTVPMSSSVLSADRLAVSGISDIREIAAVTPGVEYDFSSQFGPGISSDVSIRGISARKGDATSGIYINDTPIQMPHSVFGGPYPLTFDGELIVDKGSVVGGGPSVPAPWEGTLSARYDRPLVQLGITWALTDMTLFVDNALSSQPSLQRDGDAAGSSLPYAYTFKPRTIGLRANWRF